MCGKPVRVAITGGTGIVGQFILADLLKRDCQIRALRRTPDPKPVDSTVTWMTGDLQDRINLDTLVQGCDALVHCAFSHKAGRYRGGEGTDITDFWKTNFFGTMQLLEAAREAQVQRVVLLSSRAVFTGHWNLAGPIENNHPQRPDTHYGALKAATEILSNLYTKPTGPIIVSLRATGVYGLLQPVQNSKWYDLAKQVLAGVTIEESRTSTEVHGKDLASAVWLLLTTPAKNITQPGYNCSDIEISTRDLVATMLSQLDRQGTLPDATPPVVSPMGCKMLKALGWQPGGTALLQQTIAELLAAARN